MQLAAFDMHERIRAELELGDLNQKLEQRVLERTAQLKSEITARTKAEEAMRDWRRSSRRPEMRLSARRWDGVITSWNRGAENLFGYSEHEAVGKPILMLFPSERIAEESELLSRIARGESNRTF